MTPCPTASDFRSLTWSRLQTPPLEGPDLPAAQPGPRIMHPATAPQFRRLRPLMERWWMPHMMETLGIGKEELPILWEAEFLYRPHTPGGEAHDLCERIERALRQSSRLFHR